MWLGDATELDVLKADMMARVMLTVVAEGCDGAGRAESLPQGAQLNGGPVNDRGTGSAKEPGAPPSYPLLFAILLGWHALLGRWPGPSSSLPLPCPSKEPGASPSYPLLFAILLGWRAVLGRRWSGPSSSLPVGWGGLVGWGEGSRVWGGRLVGWSGGSRVWGAKRVTVCGARNS